MLESRSGLSAFFAGVALLPFAFALSSPCDAAVTISTAQTQNMSCTNGICTPTAVTAVLNINDLTNLLASGNVSVNTGSGNLAQQVEDIIVAASFNWASVNSLTLDAYRSATFLAPVSVNGSGAVSLVTNDGGSGGFLSFISGGSLSFLSLTNSLSIGGKTYVLVSSLPSLIADIAADPSGHYALSASYNAGQDGTYSMSPISTRFKGTFNGLGNTISNLAISATQREVGLFAQVNKAGTISSVRVTNANVKAGDGKKRTGALAGVLVALNYGTVFNDFASGQIQGKLGGSGEIGGLVGNSFGSIINSAAATSVVAKVNNNVPANAGGLAGGNSGTVERSFATGSATVAGRFGAGDAGGLVGLNAGPTQNCYAGGSVSVLDTGFVGGLVGLTSSTIAEAYSAGAPTGGSGSQVGGVVGADDHQVNGGYIANDYWDTTTSGITNLSQGAGNIANDPGITGQTTAQLQAGLPAGFDPTIWAENPNINSGLPYLIANPPQ